MNELLMLTAFIFSGLGYVGGYFSSEGKNNRSTAKRCNRKYETRPMIGEEYLRFLRHEEQSLYDKKLVDEIEAVFHCKEWVEKKGKFKIIEKVQYTISADFDSFQDFEVKIKSIENRRNRDS